MREVVDETIRKLAADDGARWAAASGRSEDHLDFNVNRCRSAECYKELGLLDLGFRVHCNRDHAMVVGFNSELELSRSRTIMEGATCCDFRFRKRP